MQYLFRINARNYFCNYYMVTFYLLLEVASSRLIEKGSFRVFFRQRFKLGVRTIIP